MTSGHLISVQPHTRGKRLKLRAIIQELEVIILQQFVKWVEQRITWLFLEVRQLTIQHSILCVCLTLGAWLKTLQESGFGLRLTRIIWVLLGGISIKLFSLKVWCLYSEVDSNAITKNFRLRCTTLTAFNGLNSIPFKDSGLHLGQTRATAYSCTVALTTLILTTLRMILSTSISCSFSNSTTNCCQKSTQRMAIGLQGINWSSSLQTKPRLLMTTPECLQDLWKELEFTLNISNDHVN